MEIEKVIDHFKGLQNTATALSKSKQHVSSWRQKGKIPILHQCLIEYVTHGEFKVDTSDLPFDLIVKGQTKSQESSTNE